MFKRYLNDDERFRQELKTAITEYLDDSGWTDKYYVDSILRKLQKETVEEYVRKELLLAMAKEEQKYQTPVYTSFLKQVVKDLKDLQLVSKDV